MDIKLWGTRGSLATPDPQMARYGGNTACVEVRGQAGTVLVLDAGTGIRPLGNTLGHISPRLDILLTHLHMDHIQGLGFFAPIFNPQMDIHIWGPASTTLNLLSRITRYLSPPLFPIRINELPSQITLHEVPCAAFDIGEFHIQTMLVCHPGPTVGYRITENYPHGPTITYLPDHEPALGVGKFPLSPAWTSGYSLAAQADLLIHDTQYTHHTYTTRHVGWGHSSLVDAFKFATLAEVEQLVTFHYDPAHNDDTIDGMISAALADANLQFRVIPGQEGILFSL
ncbi:MAG: MBL fold metallo-hydrolase [Anaerolineae bacterium]|nr:MBL fold metallo-hydrolase [Anaerolineae bacterium]